MTKTDLIAIVAEKSGLSKKDADKAIAAALDAVKGALAAGEEVRLVGFGTFAVKNVAERKGRNPSTGAEMIIPASKAPKFTAGKALKDAVK